MPFTPLDSTPLNPMGSIQTALSPQLQKKSPIQQALDFLGTPGGGALTGLVGSGLSAYGQYQQGQQQMKQSAAQNAAGITQNQFNADRQDQLSRAQGVLAADPLGADQKLAQHNALLKAILPNIRNTDSGFGSANRGGIMGALPQQGFDPMMVDQNFGANATAGAIAQRHKEINSLDPNAAQPDLSSLFGNDPAVAKYQPQIRQWAEQLQQKTGAEKAAFEAQLQGYINKMANEEQGDGNGFWHKFAKVAGIVGAGVATVMTAGGASPLLAGAIGMGAGAASSFGNSSSPVAGAATSALSNPALYNAILGRG
jgi:hypothetical protein